MFKLSRSFKMSDAEMLEKLKSSYETLSKERNAIVVPLHDIVKKSGFAPNQAKKCEGLLRNSCLYKLDSKKEGILVNKKNFKPMEPTMQNQQPTNTPTKIHDRIERIINALAQGLYEKEVAVRLALLTAIAGESIFFLGKPGYAKSMIACRLQQAFKSNGGGEAKYFEYLMNQFSTPEDIFGPISLKALNGEGENKEEEYKRIIKNMLPEADIAFLDEIWKASAAIQNTLLTIINERKYRNGNKMIDVPLKALFAASNELPAKNRGLEALFDRFIMRLIVVPIKDESEFFEMVNEPSSQKFKLPNDVLAISVDEWNSWKEKIDEVTLSSEAKAVISAIRKELIVRNDAMSEEDKQNDELFEVSDRRWKKVVHILKASAFLNDRTEVDLMDCQLIEYCIWSTEKQQKQARDIVEKCIKQNGLECDTAIDEISEEVHTFAQKIDETFYEPEYETIKGQPKVFKIGNENCYEVRASDGNFYFVGKTYYYTSAQGNDRRNIYNNTMRKNGDTISWMYDYYHSMSGEILFDSDTTRPTGKLVRNSLFNNKSAFAATCKSFDESYEVIKEKIIQEIREVDVFANEQSTPYKTNLFADQRCCDVIMNAVKEAKKELQDVQIELDKSRSRYQT